MEPKIADYALIGSCRSAALVSKYGSIDWCCLPEFDSPSIFAALLDRQKGGYFSINPAGGYQSAQRYVPETNVVETHFTTDEGEVRLLDAFTATSEAQKARSLFPDHEILRIVEGVKGKVRMKMRCVPRYDYGQGVPVFKDYQKLGIRFSFKENVYTLLTTLEAEDVEITGGEITAEFDINFEQRLIFSLSHSSQSPAILPELRVSGLNRMLNTIDLWKKWIKQCNYSGLYAEEVKRSAMALKLLTYAPSGAIIAAPTSSLPEEPGGERNWDYRYCWLRDASFTTRVLLSLGFKEETHAYMNWILHATRLTRPRLQVVYSIFGEASLKEKLLSWLAGYRNSRPVRTGNGADRQFQLDVYGEVLDAAFTYASLVKQFDRETKKFLIGLGEMICKSWEKPDSGIWEVRSESVHHTHSKVMAWVGLDRLVKLGAMYNWKETSIRQFKETADRIHEEVDRHGYNHELKSYTRELGGNSLDASVLTFSLVGYSDPTSEKMMASSEAIYKYLSNNDLVYRYRNIDDGLKGSEGAFGVCSFWLAENFAKSGKLKEAIRIFETMLRHASPAGLFSEEVDPQTGELTGNYPQGFTHIGLINAALTIDEVYRQQSYSG
jgi:GH15 family glucan-1,4-alpha-glucosidase